MSTKLIARAPFQGSVYSVGSVVCSHVLSLILVSFKPTVSIDKGGVNASPQEKQILDWHLFKEGQKRERYKHGHFLLTVTALIVYIAGVSLSGRNSFN